MPEASHFLAAGVVIRRDDEVLLVKDSGRWSLPRGTSEPGEPLWEAARREAEEETGFHVSVKGVAFVSEAVFPQSQKWSPQLHVYFEAEIIDGSIDSRDPDIEEVKFVSVEELRSYLDHRPWLVPLQDWLNNGRTAYHYFDLDSEDSSVRDGSAS